MNTLVCSRANRNWLSLLGLILFTSFLLSGCTSPSPRDPDDWEEPSSPSGEYRPIEMQPVEPENIITDPEPVPVAPIPTRPERELGWIVTTPDRNAIFDVILRAPEYGVTYVQIGGDIVQNIDELIFNTEKQQLIRDIAQSLDRIGVDTYITSRELTLDSRTFRFHIADPLVAARKSAYVSVMEQIPELDGVVLSLNESKLEPWSAEIPSDQMALSNPERIRFVIDMVRDAVVNNMNKRLLVCADSDTQDETKWFTEAMQSYPTEGITLLVPISLTGQLEVGPLHPLVSRFAPYRPVLEMDLTGEMFGGPYFLYCLPDALQKSLSQLDPNQFAGFAGIVQNSYGIPTQSPNEINLFALGEISRTMSPFSEALWETWLSKRYNMQSLTPESQAMKRIMRTSYEWGQKMVLVKGILPIRIRGRVPSSITALQQYWDQIIPRNDPRVEQIHREMDSRRKLFLVEMGQESFEAMEELDAALRELQNVQTVMLAADYNRIAQRLTEQRRMAAVDYYLKQCIWGFIFWKTYHDEMETLHLEAHLQRLDQLAGEIAAYRSASSRFPADPADIRSLVASIRAEFPRVIAGIRERNWNHIREVTIRQAGPNRIELSWKSDAPSTSKLFVTDRLPSFSRFQDASTVPSIDHHIVVENLQPGTGYYFKIQCISDGEVTNSGNFYFRLEPQTMM